MLKKLRHRFILLTMSLTGVVLLTITLLICANIYQSQMNMVERSLDIGLAEAESQLPQRPDMENMENPNPVVAVLVDDDFSIISSYSDLGYLSQSSLKEVVNATSRLDTLEGRLAQYKLAFKGVRTRTGNILIAYTSYKKSYETILHSILMAVFIFIVLMVIFLAISIGLSRTALKPVETAWHQQQQFIADASHELKTPITAILANNNIVLEHGECSIAEQRKWIENSQAEANHMKDLVNNMLFLAKSDGDEVQLLFNDIVLSNIATDTILQFEPVAFENGITLDADIEDDIHINGDITQLRQLVNILIDNACKYAGEDGHIDFSLHRVGNAIEMVATNTGTPIPPDDLPHIFERFYRSDKARTQQNQAGGYGLGLAIAQRIVKAHKGTITATSSETTGTTFKVIFK